MEIQTLRKIVHDKLRDTNDIKNRKIAAYIKSHDMTHTENQNGIFVNISLCPEEHILAIYNIMNLNDLPDTHMDRYIDPVSGSGCGGSGGDQSLPPDLITTYPENPETQGNGALDFQATDLEEMILKYSFT